MRAKREPRDESWRWEMPTNGSVVRMLVPDAELECRVVIQGDEHGWRRIVRIDLGLELHADIPVPEETREVLKVKPQRGIDEKSAVAAVRAAFRQLRVYEATRVARSSRTTGRVSGSRLTGSLGELVGDQRLQAVAGLYREYVEEQGLTRYSRHLGEAFGVSPQRAKELVEEARRKGFLGKAKPGAVGEVRQPRKSSKGTNR